MSRAEEQQAQLTAFVDALLITGTSMTTLIDMFAAILRLNSMPHEADQIRAMAHGEPSPDVELIAAWFDDQAVKEHELYNSGNCNNPVLTLERWMVYKASAQSVREGAWRKKL